MQLEELKPGRRYKLARDVENSQLDKRERYDAAKLAWTEGDVFRATTTEDNDFYALVPLSINATPRAPHGPIYRYHESIDALIDALIELPERTRDVEARTYVEADDILDRLVDTGLLTMEQINNVAEYLRAEENAQYEAEQAAKKGNTP